MVIQEGRETKVQKKRKQYVNHQGHGKEKEKEKLCIKKIRILRN